MGYQSLPNRVLAFVLRKVKYTNARGTRSGCWGRGGGAKEEKSKHESEKKPATSRYSQSANGKGTKNSTSSRANRAPYTRKGPVTSPWGRGGSPGGGCLLRLWGAKTLPARSAPSPGQQRSGLPSVTFALGRLPSARWSPYLARPPAFVLPARPQPASRGPRDSCGREPGGGRAQWERQAVCSGARGREGRAGTEGAPPAGSRASVRAVRAPAGGTRWAQAAAPSCQGKERDSLRGPCPCAHISPHSGFRQLAAIATRPQKVSRRRKRLEGKFSLAPRSLSPSP